MELEREIATRLELEREEALAKVRGERDLALQAAGLAQLRADNLRLEEKLREERRRRES
ncbi:MAG: hypothetical protein H6726_00390 [Sandaracinaceae bacterium]|nr:hypothetical protein [Sandaracinaceae bacterium]